MKNSLRYEALRMLAGVNVRQSSIGRTGAAGER